MPQKITDNITNTPLSREELALYTTHLATESNKKIDSLSATFAKTLSSITTDYKKQIANLSDIIGCVSTTILSWDKKFSDAKNNMLDAITAILPMKMKDSIKQAITELIPVITEEIKKSWGNSGVSINQAPLNPLFYSILTEAKQLLWIDYARGKIASICLDNDGNKGSIYSYAYAKMKNEGYDVNALLETYKRINPKADTLTMISASDTLRILFEKCINSYVHNKTMTNKTSVKDDAKKTAAIIKELNAVSTPRKPSYRLANSCPDNVREIVKRFARTDNPTTMDFVQAYNLLDVDRDKVIEKTKINTGYKNVSFGYVIGNNPALLAMFNQVVNDYLNRNE